MSTMLIGKKVGMTRIYTDSGRIVPVTVIQAGPCVVTQVKSEESDSYNALQLGYDLVKPSRQKKPQIGRAKKAGIPVSRYLREVRLVEPAANEIGDELTVAEFDEIKYVDVTGTSKGHGFTGAMKRHGFKGLEASHGVERKHRSLGSVGGNAANAGTSRGIRKGKKMSGHHGNVTSTSKNHEVISIDPENHLIVIKGPVPGPKNGLVMVSKAKTKG